MLRKFAMWFIIFGVSFLAQNLGWADQGTAFIWLELIGHVVIFIVFIASLFAGDGGFTILIAINEVISLGIIFLATWGVSKLFDVDFAVAFQIMTFGQCLCVSSSKKDNDN